MAQRRFEKACKIDDLDNMIKALKEGADVNAPFSDRRDGLTALHQAARMGRADIVNILLAHGANIHSRTNDGRTPVMMAERLGRTTVIPLLQKQEEKKVIGSTKGLFSKEIIQRLTVPEMDNLRRLVDYVCLLDIPTSTTNMPATAFLIGFIQQAQTIYAAILTNNHVVEHWVEHQPGVAYFNYIDDRIGKQNGVNITKHNLLPNKELDYAVICVDNDLIKNHFVSKPRLIDTVRKLHPDDKTIILCGHPGGEVKQADCLQICDRNDIDKNIKVQTALKSMNDGFQKSINLQYLNEKSRTIYHGSSFTGASGSPCFKLIQDRVELVCLHTGGIYVVCTDPQPNQPSDFEFGVLMHEIKDHINFTLLTKGMQWV